MAVFSTSSYQCFSLHICDVEILAKFSPKIAKLVDITLKKNMFVQNFLVKKSENLLQKKTLLPIGDHHLGYVNKFPKQKHIVYPVKVNFASETKYYLKPHLDPPLPLPTLYRPTTSLPTFHCQVYHEAPT
jgi:hypothetical protein